MFLKPSTFGICTCVTTCLVFTFAYLLYKYFTRHFDYWKKRNIPYLKPFPFVGNFKDVATFKISITDFHRKIYEATNEPYVGVFFFDEPFLMVRSPELLKSIMIRDFDYFRDKSVYTPDHDEVQANLMFWQPSRLGWKQVRSRISPFFTSGKLKAMFPLVAKVGNDFKEYMHANCVDKVLDAKKLSTKFTTEAITKCAFGIDANCFKYEDAEFRKVGASMFEFTIRNVVSQVSYFYFQSLARLFRMSFYGIGNMKFLCDVLKRVIEEREKSGLKGNDLIDFLVQLRKENFKELEGDKIYSPPINLFIGGFETAASTISMTLHELCLNRDIQDKLRSEILEITEHGITYEGLIRMKYLDQCVKETLRKYAPVPFSDRLCIKDYKIPGTETIIEKGTPIYIPMMGHHYDEQFFPDPEKFIPERFEDMSKINESGIYYYPFGDGPRACVGERFGMMSVKLAIVSVISEFEVEKTERTPDKPVFEKKSLILQIENGVPVKLRPLNK